MSTQKVELVVGAITASQQHIRNFYVVLSEKYGIRKMPIVIGRVESQAIELAANNIKPTRPSTHDLLNNMMVAHGIILNEVFIYKLQEGIFYSKLFCSSAIGELEIDSRTSDAVALALRFSANIYTTEEILNVTNAQIVQKNGDQNINLQQGTSPKSKNSAKPENPLNRFTLLELNKQLDEALEHEDYAKAAVLRDEINARRK
jgi:uncharacterized protein